MGPKLNPQPNAPVVLTRARLAELGLTPEDFTDELDAATSAWHLRWLETGEGDPWPPDFQP